MKNLEAAKELLSKYKSVTLEELKQLFEQTPENKCDIIENEKEYYNRRRSKKNNKRKKYFDIIDNEIKNNNLRI